MQDGSKKAIIAAFSANLGIAVAKFVGFAITGSSGLLAEAGHSLADTGNQALLLFGSKRAARDIDRAHPFGHGRERFFWAFVVALVLFSMGGLFALYEGIEKLRHPHATESVGIALGILAVAVVLEGLSLRTAVAEANHHRTAGTSWWRFIRETRSPELPIVLLEDVGALLGLVFALSGLLLAHVTHNPRWDAVGSVAIGGLLVVIALVLAVEMKGLLVGETATEEAEEAIRTAVAGHPLVNRVIHLKTQQVGPDEVFVGVKVELDRTLTVPQLAVAIDDVERVLRLAEPTARFVYIEPDIARDDA